MCTRTSAEKAQPITARDERLKGIIAAKKAEDFDLLPKEWGLFNCCHVYVPFGNQSTNLTSFGGPKAEVEINAGLVGKKCELESMLVCAHRR